MKIKVCFITTVHSVYDTRIFHKEALSLVNHGYEVVIIAPHDSDEIINGIRIVALPKKRSRLQRFLGLLSPLGSALKEKADVYHVHDPELLVTLAALRLLTHAKLIYDVHEDVPKQIMSKYWIPLRFRRLVAKTAKLFEKLISPTLHGVLTATPAIARNFPLKTTRIIQNMPIFAELDSTRKKPYGSRDPMIVYVGKISVVRGAGEMMSAMTHLSPVLNARLKLVGTFSPSELEREIKTMPGSDCVDFLGWQDRQAIREIFAESRIGLVLFHPEPNHIESQPNKLFEYMSAGLPVVASHFPYWRSIIDQAGCGFLVNPLDPKEIAEAVTYLLEHPKEAAAMGQNGWDAVRKQYNWAHESKKLLEFYKVLTA